MQFVESNYHVKLMFIKYQIDADILVDAGVH